MKFKIYIKNKKLITNLIIFSTIFLLLFNSKIVINCIEISINLFLHKLIPSLFIYILITELLINSDKIYDLAYGISCILSCMFRVPKHVTSSIVVGYMLGYPNSAKVIFKMYKDGNIDTTLAKKLVSFTSNANLSYIISAVGISMFNSTSIGIILAISHILSSIIIGIIYNPIYSTSIIQQTKINSNTFFKISNPFELLLKSVFGTLKTLAIIFSYTIIFSLIPTLIFSSNTIYVPLKAFLIGIFEVSNGINLLACLDLALNIKLTLISFILSFSSLMVIMQIYSFVTYAKVKLTDVIKYKLIQGLLASSITYIITSYIYTPNITAFSNITNNQNVNCILPSTYYIFVCALVSLIIFIMYRKKRQ